VAAARRVLLLEHLVLLLLDIVLRLLPPFETWRIPDASVSAFKSSSRRPRRTRRRKRREDCFHLSRWGKGLLLHLHLFRQVKELLLLYHQRCQLNSAALQCRALQHARKTSGLVCVRHLDAVHRCSLS
jgi:hypothetical protein